MADPRLTVVRIPRHAELRLDPITLYLEDEEPGRGRAVITCYDQAWTCRWGGMGTERTVAQFLAIVDRYYLADNMVRGLPFRPRGPGQAYVLRIAQAVIEHMGRRASTPAHAAVAGRAHHCQNGRADVCLASQRDGVICPEASCDIDDGIRPDHTKAAQPAAGESVATIRAEEYTRGRNDGWEAAQRPSTLLLAGWVFEVEGERVRVTKPDGSVSEWPRRPATNGSGMYDLCRAIAAERAAGEADTCPPPGDELDRLARIIAETPGPHVALDKADATAICQYANARRAGFTP